MRSKLSVFKKIFKQEVVITLNNRIQQDFSIFAIYMLMLTKNM
jgi:hypothetical protein